VAPERSIYVYGAGAVGGYLGGKLLAGSADSPLVLIGRQPLAEAVRAHGLVLCEDATDIVTHPRVVTAAEDLPPADLILFAVRADDVERSIPHLSRLLGDDGLLLALQNGVGTEGDLARALGPGRVLPASLTVSVVMEEPGIITRTSKGGGVALATMDKSPVPEWIMARLATTCLPTAAVNDYRSLRWSKLLLNMLGAATSAILDLDIEALFTNPDIFRVEQLAFREATRVMDALGVETLDLPGYRVRAARLAMRLPRPLAQAILAPRVIAARSGRSPGSRADMARGRSELAWYNGAIGDTAASLGRRAPVNAALAALAADLVEHPKRRADYRGKPERLLAHLGDAGIRIG
jgi:2-dehydropantoate 2-reductase